MWGFKVLVFGLLVVTVTSVPNPQFGGLSAAAGFSGQISGGFYGSCSKFGQIATVYGGKTAVSTWSSFTNYFGSGPPQSFNEGIVYLLAFSKLIADITDTFFPGVGTAWFQAWYAVIVMTTCNGGIGKYFTFAGASKSTRSDFISQCDPRFAKQWGITPFNGGDFAKNKDVANFYGISGGAYRKFLKSLQKYGGGGKDLDGFQGAQQLCFQNMLTFYGYIRDWSSRGFRKSYQVTFFTKALNAWTSTATAFVAPFPIIGSQIAYGFFDFISQFSYTKNGNGKGNQICGDKNDFFSGYTNFFSEGKFFGKDISGFDTSGLPGSGSIPGNDSPSDSGDSGDYSYGSSEVDDDKNNNYGTDGPGIQTGDDDNNDNNDGTDGPGIQTGDDDNNDGSDSLGVPPVKNGDDGTNGPSGITPSNSDSDSSEWDNGWLY